MSTERPEAVGPIEKRVYDVIDDLDRGLVSGPVRGTLRKALDKADAPLTGRAAGDKALGNLTGNRR